MSKECNNVYINSFLVLYIVSFFSLFKPWGRIDILRSYCASTRHAASSFSIFLRNISRKMFMKFKWQESPLDITINIYRSQLDSFEKMKIVEHYCTCTTHVQEFIFTKISVLWNYFKLDAQRPRQVDVVIKS